MHKTFDFSILPESQERSRRECTCLSTALHPQHAKSLIGGLVTSRSGFRLESFISGNHEKEGTSFVGSRMQLYALFFILPHMAAGPRGSAQTWFLYGS